MLRYLLLFLLLFSQTSWGVETPARNISTDCTQWHKNLNCGDSNQQLVDNVLDQFAGGGGTWGSITGTLSNQTDLQSALNAKQNSITTGTTAQYFRGDLSLATFPTNISFFTNDSGYITNVGIGTSQTISYWASTNSIGSLNTSIYPSLTELSYVKGVTLGIQAQLNGKQASGSYITTLSPITLASPNVGIGSTAPGQALDVQGTVRALSSQIIGTHPGTTVVVASSTSRNKASADFIGNGTTDDVAIQAAVNALPAGGGRIVLLEGTYIITSTLSIISTGSVVIQGMGLNSTNLYAGNSLNADVIYVHPGSLATFFELKDLSISGNNSNNSMGDELHCSSNIQDVHVINVFFSQPAGYGVEIDDSWGLDFSHSLIEGGLSDGLHIVNGNIDAKIDTNKIYNNAGDAIYVPANAYNNTITNNSLDAGNGKCGINLNANWNTINSNKFINIDNHSFTGICGNNNTNNNTFIGNVFLDAYGSMTNSYNFTSGTYSNSIIGSVYYLNGSNLVLDAGTNNYFEDATGGYNAQGAIQIRNVGNVGIGTFIPKGSFQLYNNGMASGSLLTSNSIGVGTWMPTSSLGFQGNLGIGTYSVLTNQGTGLINYQPIISLTTTGTSGASTFTPSTGALNIPNYASGTVNQGSIADLGTYSSTGTAISGTAGKIVLVGSNIGIGTVTPIGLLDTQGTLRIFSVNPSGSVGIGTTLNNPNTSLVIMGGNVGIGTWAPTFALQSMGNIGVGTYNLCSTQGYCESGYQSNLGLGTYNACSTNGSCTTGFQPSLGIGTYSACSTNGSCTTNFVTSVTGTSPLQSSGGTAPAISIIGSTGTGTNFVLQTSPTTTNETLQGSVGIGTTTINGAGATINGLLDVQGTLTNFNVIASGMVGLGTTLNSPNSALIVMNGNIGVGTWAPGAILDVKGTLNHFFINTSGNVGIGTTLDSPNTALAIMSGNLGIGTWAPSSALQVSGGAIVSGNTGIGVTSSLEPLDVQGTLTNFNVLTSGMVGIGTTQNAPATALAIVSGAVGVGTWAPVGLLQIAGTGNVGVGTLNPGQAFDVQGNIRSSADVILGGNLAGGKTGNVGIGTFVAAAATCDSVCNTTNNLRCFFGFKNSIAQPSIEPCSASISGNCVCLPAT